MNNLVLWEKTRAVPPSALKTITAGRIKGMSDINPVWRLKMLTEEFGICGIGWYYNTTKKWTESHGDQICAFVDIELFVFVDGKWSMPISGTGGSMLAVKENAGIHVSDECYKMATTDAISVACKQLGFGADVYWQKDNTKYTSNTDEPGNQEPPKENNNFAKHDELVGEFHQEIARTGKSLKYFLTQAKTADAKYIKTEMLNKFIETLKALPDKA